MRETLKQDRIKHRPRRRLAIFCLELGLLGVLVSGLCATPLANALQLQLEDDLQIKTLNHGQTLHQVGLLTAGSTIDVPDTYRVPATGRVDVKATLDNWLRMSNYGDKYGKIPANHDYFFPIHIVTPAVGSKVDGLFENQEYFVKLKRLANQGNLLVTKEPARVYAFRDLIPRESLAVIPNANSDANNQCDGTCGTATPPNSPISGRNAETLRAAAAAVNVTRRQSRLPAPPRTEAPAASTGNQRFVKQGLHIGGGVCRAFIDGNGNYGPDAQLVIREINRYPIYDQARNNVSRICPRFNSFSQKQKDNFWVWVYASVAYQESSCIPNKKASPQMNDNGVAIGLMQMELRENLRRARDIRYGGNYCEGAIATPSVNIRCSAHIMADMLNTGHGLYSPYSDNYWSSLKNSPNHAAKNSIAQYKACHE